MGILRDAIAATIAREADSVSPSIEREDKTDSIFSDRIVGAQCLAPFQNYTQLSYSIEPRPNGVGGLFSVYTSVSSSTILRICIGT
jgi:hypothetical protein